MEDAESSPKAVYAFRDARVPAKCLVSVQPAGGGEPIQGIAVNVSRSGLRMGFRRAVDLRLNRGDQVKVVVTLPFRYGDFAATAEVVWLGGAESSPECGFRFLSYESAHEKRMLDFLIARPTQVLFVGCAPFADMLTAILSAHPIFPVFLSDLIAASTFVMSEEISALVVGPDLAPAEAAAFLEGVYTRQPLLNASSVVFNAGSDLTPFSGLVSRNHTFFLTQKPPPVGEMSSIVLGCIDRYWVNVRREEVEAGAKHNTNEALFQFVLQRSQTANQQNSARDLCAVAEESICEVCEADRAYCLFHDQEDETLWAPATKTRTSERECSTAAGVVSYSARTGSGASVVYAANDARYDKDADDPEGEGNEQLLIEPVLDVERHVVAVLVAVRLPQREHFSKEQQGALRIFASQLTATFGRLVTQIRIDRQDSGKSVDATTNPFTDEALQEYLRGGGEVGHLLELHSAWLEYAFSALVSFVVLGMLFVTCGHVNRYGQGHAIVRLAHKITVTAKTQGVVTDVKVQVGDHLAAGAEIATVDSSKERSEQTRIERDLEQELIRWLRDPSDTAAGKRIAELEAERQVAMVNLRMRSVVSVEGGTVNDLRVRPGQMLNLGDAVASLTDAGQHSYTLLAIFPGQYRPETKLGSPLRLEFLGYPYAYQVVPVQRLGEEVVGPREARRIVGLEHADAIAIDGPVFVAEATLPSDGFELDGLKYRYFDGLEATAEIKLRAEPILLLLAPGLRRVYRWWGLDD